MSRFMQCYIRSVIFTVQIPTQRQTETQNTLVAQWKVLCGSVMDKGSISCHTKHAQAGGAIPAAFTMPSKPPKQALRRAKVLPGNLQLLQVAPPGGRLCN